MGKSLRILNVEDSIADVDLLTRHLVAAGYELHSEVVETAETMKAALETSEWDIILCDYSMPHFNALLALDVLQRSGLDIPFIIISGTVGEEVAVEAMLMGAHDYLPKGNFTRLVPAIERELQEAGNRRVQRETEAALKGSEAEMRALFQAMNDVILVLDSEGRHLKVAPTNPSHIYGRGTYRIGKTIHEIYPVGVADFILGNIKRSLDEGRTLNVEYVLPIDGKDLWFDGTVTPMTDDSVVWVARDITERKRAENERKVISEIIQGAVSTPNLDEFLKLVHRAIGGLVYAENCFVMLYDTVTGIEHFEFWVDKYDPPPPPHLAGKGFSSYVVRSGNSLLLTEEITKQMVRSGDAEEIGSASPSWLGVPLRTPVGTIGVLVLQHYEKANAFSQRDLEFLSSVGDQIALAIEHKRTEESMIASEERYRDLVENAIDIIYTHDLKGNYTSVNKAGEQITGYKRKEALTLNMATLVAPEYLEKARQMLTAKPGAEDTAYDLEIIAKDGHRVDLEVKSRLIYENSVAVGVQGIARDITERKGAEAALEASEAGFKSLFDTANDAILVVDQGIFLACNPAAETLFGCKKEELIGSAPDLFSPREQPDGRLSAEKAGELMGAAMTGTPQNFEWKHNRLDGTLFDAEVSLNRVEFGGTIQLQGTVRDITERKRAEKQLLLQATALEAAANAIVITDAAGTINWVNPAFTEFTGYSLIEVAGQNPRILKSGEMDPEYYKSLWDTVLSGQAWHGEIVNRRKDGTTYIEEQTITPVIDANGEITNFIAIKQDITERKLAAEELQRRQTELRVLFDLMPAMIWFKDTKNNILRVNKQVAEAAGIPIENIEGRASVEIYPDEAEKFYADDRAVIESGISKLGYVETVPGPDGSQLWVQTDKVPYFDTNGEVIGIVVMAQDITERKRTDDALRETNEKFHQLADNIADVFWVRSLDMKEVYYVSPAFEQIWGRSVESLYAEPRKWADFILPEDRVRVNAAFDGLTKDSAALDIEYRIVRPDGETRWVRLRGFPVKDAAGILIRYAGIVTDITESKRAEELLRKSEIQYRTLFDGVLDGIYRTTHDGRFVDLNDAIVKMFGYSSKEEMLQVDIAKDLYFAEGDRESHFPDNDISTIDIYRMRTKNGSEIWVEDHGQYVYDEQGNVIFHEGTLRDITERKRADEALSETETRYRDLVENSTDLICTHDLQGRILSANRAVAVVMGVDLNEHIGVRNLRDIVVPEFRDAFDDYLAQIRKDGVAEGVMVVETSTGERRIWEYNNTLRTEGVKEPIVRGMARDITERKNLEEQFRQSQKMEAVGVLAGGIAHDFNNLLTAINGYSDLTLRKMPADDPFRQNIEEVKKAGVRAAELTGQLLAFSRKQVLKPAVINLNSVISNIENMLRRIIRENIELRTVLEPTLGNIKADPSQVEQIIMNLAVNARDAMPNGGTLTIETQNIYLGEDYVAQHINVSPGDFVKLTVTDTGDGIDEKTKPHIFEPFYTTKEVGKGTGLGLSMVYGVVRQSGGDIMVYSEIGHGTTFKIYLPRVDEGVERPKWNDEANETARGTETILLVEDEEVVRRLVYEILTGNGYTVLEAANGKAALEICSSYDFHIDMMLTDVIMPSMSGVELKQAVVVLLPDIKVMFMSGYTDDAIAERGVLDAAEAFIEKPFTPDALSRKVREVLHE